MLVISNNCAGAHLYNKCNCAYNNPFMWGMVFAPDMMNLIRRFSTINWGSIKPMWLTEDIASRFRHNYQPNTFGICIDNAVTIYYTHYKYDPSKVEPCIDGVDVLYCKNYDYALRKYNERTQRLMITHEDPSFLIVAYERYGWDDDAFAALQSLKTSYKLCIVTNRQLNIVHKNITVITDVALEQKCAPELIVTEYYDQIYNSLGLMTLN